MPTLSKKPRGEPLLSARGLGRRVAAVLPSRQAWCGVGRWIVRIGQAAVIVAAVLGSLEIKDRVEQDERFRLDGWPVEVVELPGWVTPEIRAELENSDLGGQGTRLSLFRPGVLREVKAAFESSPWIRQVTEIRLGYPTFAGPGVLELGLQLEKPVALVEHGGLYYLADGGAKRLGGGYREPPTEWFKVPAIIRIPSVGPLPAEGERWSSRDVLQGIVVARILEDSGILRDFPQRPVDRIDLSNLHGRVSPRKSEIVLWSGAQRLAWGRSPISAGARAVPVDDVVANLRQVLADPSTREIPVEIQLDRERGRLTGLRG